MTRDEHREACIKEMALAVLPNYIGNKHAAMKAALSDMTIAFDALRTAGARVVPVEATEEMDMAGEALSALGNVWDAMSAAGDLTNPPEKKP